MLTTLVITVNGDGFSRISIFKDYLGLFVAGVHRVARSHRDREGGAGCAKGIRWKAVLHRFFLFFITPVILLCVYSSFPPQPLFPLGYDLKFVLT